MCHLQSDMPKKPIVERLYLSIESNREVFVDDSHLLSQQQIDCIRFLYKQFVKKNPGVILNVPGSHQIVTLFLRAIFKFLDHPVLIYSKEKKLQLWEEHLAWTDNISVNNLDAKKKVHIAHCLKNTNKTWSLMIVDSSSTAPRELQQYRATFKIWITSINLWYHVESLLPICKWFYCQNQTLLKRFNELMARLEKSESNVLKAIDLDTFLEDVVFCSYDASSQPELTDSPERELPLQYSSSSVKDTRRRKNKDATGTKVKRSKPKPTDGENQELASTSDIASQNLMKNEESPNVSNTSNEVTERRMEAATVDSFFVAEKELETFDISGNKIADIKNDKDNYFENDSEPLRLELDDESCDHVPNRAESPHFSRNTINTGIEENYSSQCNTSEMKSDKPKDVLTKITEIEENAMKKFKGSFLDSIF